MTEFTLKALEFGVLGLCAVTLILVWRLLDAEQKREGYPRRGILHASYLFMAFSFSLALLNGYVQLKERNPQVGLEVDERNSTIRDVLISCYYTGNDSEQKACLHRAVVAFWPEEARKKREDKN